VGTARSKRYLKSPHGHNSGSTQNVCIRGFFLQRSCGTLILSTAVVLANVLGFFDPIRGLIQAAIKDGFIQPTNVDLVKFVDGPSDHSLHDSFDWGKVLLEAIDSWKGDPSYNIGFDWTRARDGRGEVDAISAT
jgi:hypothetical protein